VEIRAFLAVARLSSFSKAADRLHYAQSSVSAQIGALEDELAVKLEFSSRFPRIRLNLMSCAHETLPKELRDGSIDLALLLVESFQGTGLAIEPLGSESLALVSDEIAKRELARLRWEEGELAVSVLMIWCKARWISPALGALMEITRRALTASLVK
jgi:Bacterial regulatory helix-turn-helix protein, lysR family/LysR substrate binding domain